MGHHPSASTLVRSVRTPRWKVPKGRPIIAQRFIAGSAQNAQKPRRGERKRLASGRYSFVPDGTYLLGAYPPINRWAIFFRPAGLGISEWSSKRLKAPCRSASAPKRNSTGRLIATQECAP